MSFSVSYNKLEELADKYQSHNIVEKGCVLEIIHYENTAYVISGVVGNGKCGVSLVCAYRVVNINDYKGEITPLAYGEHFWEVNEGKRERSYNGLLVKYQNTRLVLIGPEVEFTSNGHSEKQLNLF